MECIGDHTLSGGQVVVDWDYEGRWELGRGTFQKGLDYTWGTFQRGSGYI